MNEREIFVAALDQPTEADRQSFLDSVCDAPMRGRVERLLKEQAQLGSFMEHPPVDAVAAEPGPTDVSGEMDATILHGDGSTYDQISGVLRPASQGPDSMSGGGDMDNGLPLGYMQPSSRPDSLGRLAHYEILEVLGRGAFGTVLKAFDEKLHRVVAIKVLAPEMAASSSARMRFLREARASAKIRHENVVSIHAVEDEPIPYLVMECIPGQTLEQRLDKHGPLDLPDVLRLGKQIADGLAAAHDQQLIHRDVKPGNILLETGVDHVKITDFGLARSVDDASMTQSGVIAGTPMYMAPEQALGETLDQRADLFSLGSVLYQLLTGRPPFRAPSTLAVLKRVTEDTPRPIREIVPETPIWMCQIIGRLHAKHPDRRYASARELSDLLEYCLTELAQGRTPHIAAAQATPGHVGAAAPAPTPSPTRGRFSRGPRLIAAAVLVLLAGLAVTEATGVTQLAATVIRLTTGSGTLVIETDDPSVTVSIDGEEVVIRGVGVEELSLRPGQYKVAASKDGQPVKQELVSITRNGRTTVRMTLEGGEQFTGNGPESSYLKKTLFGHAGKVFTVVFSPDGRLLASAGEGSVRVWHARTGALVHVLAVSDQATFHAVTFSPDSRFLLTAPQSGKAPAPIRIWESQTGKPAGTLKGHSAGLYELSFLPDKNTLIACGGFPEIGLWDFAARSKLWDIPATADGWVRSAVGSKRGKIAFGAYTLTLAELDGKLVRSINRRAGPLSFCPDGRWLAGTTWKEGLVSVWDGDTGDAIAVWRAHAGTANGVAFSKGNVLATAGGDHMVRLWDVETRRELAALPHDAETYGVAFSADGQTLASTSYDGLVKLWDVSAIPAQQREKGASSRPLERPQDAPRSANAPTLKKTFPGHPGNIFTMAYSADGRLLASGGEGSVRVWDAATESLRYALPVAGDGRYSAIAFSRDGKLLLTGSSNSAADNAIRMWDAETGKPAGVLGTTRGVYEVSFSPDGNTLLCCGWDQWIRVWDFPAREKRLDISTSDWTRSAVYSTAGKIAYSSSDRVFLCNADGTPIKTIEEPVGMLCFSPDGRWLAGATWRQGVVTVWDGQTGEEIASWRGHSSYAEGVSFSGEGNVLASAGGDGTVRLWDPDTGRQLAELPHGQHVSGVAFSPDGITLATGAKDGLVRLWDVSRVLTQQREKRANLKPIQWPADAPPPATAPFDAEQAKAHQQAWAEYLGVPVEKEVVLGQDADGKDVALAMVLIPPGEFLMGSTAEEQTHFIEIAKAVGHTRDVHGIPGEGPRHRVRITRPFWLSRYEVTIGQFRRFAETREYKTDAQRDSLGGYALVDQQWTRSTQFVWNGDLGFPQTDNHPVSNVTWNDATAFCGWLSQHCDEKFALPTEAQWEYACRAGTTNVWQSVETEDDLQQFAWVRPISGDITHEVGGLKPNPLGLFDMHGNVWEWCADWYAPDYYVQAPENDPSGPAAGMEHVFRGGSWATMPRRCRTALRGRYPPDARFPYLGFRVTAGLSEDLLRAKLSADASRRVDSDGS